MRDTGEGDVCNQQHDGEVSAKVESDTPYVSDDFVRESERTPRYARTTPHGQPAKNTLSIKRCVRAPQRTMRTLNLAKRQLSVVLQKIFSMGPGKPTRRPATA